MPRLYKLGAALALVIVVCVEPSTFRAFASTRVSPDGPTIEIDDVRRFYDLYDAAGGRPTAEQLQRDYLDRGSAGLRVFTNARNTTAERIAQAIATRPAIYADARRCVSMLPRVRQRADAALRGLHRLYPRRGSRRSRSSSAAVGPWP